MKRVVIFIVSIFIFTGCFKFESTQLKEIQEAFPNCEIRKLPDQNGDKWILKNSENKVIYVYFDNGNNMVAIPIF